MKRFLLVGACALSLAACGMSVSQFENIPAGHVGKIITPNGWEKGLHEAGQVDLRGTNSNGQQNSLVFLEVTSHQITESFSDNIGEHREDHRIITAGNAGIAGEGHTDDAHSTGQIPIAVDVYLRLRVPTDDRHRNRIFAEVTPDKVKDHDRASLITVETVYKQYVRQEVRSVIRKVIGNYADDLAVNTHRTPIETELTRLIFARLQQLGSPLEIQSVSLSNVTPDRVIQENRNARSGAAARVASIEAVGAALNNNPRYIDLEQVRATERIAIESAKAGKPVTLIIGVDGPGAHAYAARQ